MKPEVITKNKQQWSYETDEKYGICIIAKDKMTIKFRFECTGSEFYDVLKIDAVIDEKLKEPVSVEGMADYLIGVFPGLAVRVSGRADSHGWITSEVR